MHIHASADFIFFSKIFWNFTYALLKYYVYLKPPMKRLRLSKHPAYNTFLQSMKSDRTALFLDIGCCCKFSKFSKFFPQLFLVGADIRKAIADGCSGENIVGSDLYPGRK